MPVKADRIEPRPGPLLRVARERQSQQDEQRDQADTDVQSVKTSQGKERRREEIRVYIDAALEEMPILEPLAAEKNSAEDNGRAQPANHLALVVMAQAGLRAPDRKAAREKAEAKQAGLEQVQFARVRSGLRAWHCNKEKPE